MPHDLACCNLAMEPVLPAWLHSAQCQFCSLPWWSICAQQLERLQVHRTRALPVKRHASTVGLNTPVATRRRSAYEAEVWLWVASCLGSPTPELSVHMRSMLTRAGAEPRCMILHGSGLAVTALFKSNKLTVMVGTRPDLYRSM